MGEIFQLSIELYDIKSSKVIWSDRWQEDWDNLPMIKGRLSDGLLKALDTTSKVEKKVETENTEAYKYYLKAKHIHDKRENLKDTEIARGLLKKAIELDNNLIVAKVALGFSYSYTGDYDRAMEINTSAVKQAEEIGDKRGIGDSLNNIGFLYFGTGDYEKALDYCEKAFAIREELGDKHGIGGSLANIGMMHKNKGDLDRALDYYGRSLSIREELGDKYGIGDNLSNIGFVHENKGDLDTALDYFGRSLSIREELGDKYGIGGSLDSIGIVHKDKGDFDTALDYYGRSLAINEELSGKYGMGFNLLGIGIVHHNKGDYDKAEEYLDKSLAIQKETRFKLIEFATTTYLYLTYKHLGKDYDEKEIHTLIKEAENINFELNLRLYELLEDKTYLEKAYNQVQEKASAMDDGAKFLELKIPKAIVEEWEKVK
jgi:tetratricopeptide (TPR) repeat protein